MIKTLPEPAVFRRTLQKTAIHLIAALACYALARFWAELPGGAPESGLLKDIGRPGGWRFFFGMLVPLAWLLLSLCGELICAWWHRLAPGSELRLEVCRKFLRLDNWGLGLLPLLCLGLALHAWLGDYRTILGLFYLLAVAGKTWLLAWMLGRIARDPAMRPQVAPKSEPMMAFCLGLISLALFSALAFWTIQAVSCAGDEINYLYKIHERLHGLGILGGDPQDPEVRSAFYWGRWSHNLVTSPPQSPLYFWILAPGYLLAGRLGTLLTMSCFGALALGGFYTLCRRMQYSRARSLFACWFLMASPPFLIFTQHTYPEMIGGAAACLGLLLLLNLRESPWRKLALLLALAVCISLTKSRLMPLGAILCLLGGLKFLHLLGGKRLVAIGGLAVAAGVVLIALFPGAVPINFHYHTVVKHVQVLKQDALVLPAAGAALLFDQEFGLIAFMPLMLFSLSGLYFFWRAQTLPARYSVIISGFFFLIIVAWRWLQWDGGFGPPARFLMAVTPLWALWSLPALAGRAPRLWRGLVTLTFGLTLAMSLALNLFPMLRYHRRTGMNNLLFQLGELTQSDVTRFFPSFANYYPPDMLKALPWVLLIPALAVWMALWRKRPGQVKEIRLCWGRALLILLLGLSALTAAGRTLPNRAIEGEAMQTGGAGYYGSYFPYPVYAVMGREGNWCSKQFIWGEDRRYLTLAARRQVVGPEGKDAFNPELRIVIDGKPVGELKVSSDVTRYRVGLQLEPGRHLLKLVYAKQYGRDQILLDRIEFD